MTYCLYNDKLIKSCLHQYKRADTLSRKKNNNGQENTTKYWWNAWRAIRKLLVEQVCLMSQSWDNAVSMHDNLQCHAHKT